eukprot:scaffold271346_cov60-Attheya_sp.AAC.4
MASSSIPTDVTQRRVIKAIPPSPPPKDHMETMLIHQRRQDDKEDESREAATASKQQHQKSNLSYSGGSPSVKEEQLREWTDIWRTERLEASAAVRKEHKHQDLDQRRRAGSLGNVILDEETKSPGVVHSTDDIPSILKVSPQFPEHKRSFDMTHPSLEELERLDKRLKSLEEDDDLDSTSGGLDEKNDYGGRKMYAALLRSVSKSTVAAVAVGITAVYLFSILRRK